jgi:hypothetical protein
MNIQSVLFSILLFFGQSSFRSDLARQNNKNSVMVQDSATTKMQQMMWKIIQQAPDDFKRMKGNEVSRSNNKVFYTANLAGTITDMEEMKAALASDLFGAMLTTEDNIVETGGSTIYVARYKDDSSEFSLAAIVKDAFIGLPAFLKLGAGVAEIKEEPTAADAKQKTYMLVINNVNIAAYNYDENEGKGVLVIGIEK